MNRTAQTPQATEGIIPVKPNLPESPKLSESKPQTTEPIFSPNNKVPCLVIGGDEIFAMHFFHGHQAKYIRLIIENQFDLRFVEPAELSEVGSIQYVETRTYEAGKPHYEFECYDKHGNLVCEPSCSAP